MLSGVLGHWPGGGGPIITPGGGCIPWGGGIAPGGGPIIPGGGGGIIPRYYDRYHKI